MMETKPDFNPASDKIYSVCNSHQTHDPHKEIWGDVSGWPYQASTFGRIRRTPGTKANWKNVSALRPQKIGRPGKQYLGVLLSVGARKKTFYVHALVAATFLGPTPAGMEIDHKDGNKLNPALSNLCFKTPSKNIIDSVERGHRGESRWNARLTPNAVTEILLLHGDGYTVKELSNRFSVSQSTIYHVIRGDNWSHVTRPAA